MITKSSALSLAQWLANDQPRLFQALLEKAAQLKAAQGLGDFSDILSSIGSGISTAVSNVGSFLTSPAGMTTLTTIGTAYLNNQTQSNVLNAQVKIAQAGKTVAPIQTVYNPNTGQYEASYTTAGAQYPVTSQLLSSITPASSMQQYLPYLLIGGGLLVVLMLFRSR